MRKFFFFFLVGTIGFLVDTAVLYLCVFVGKLGLYNGRLISYLAAATTTWYFNRHLTFAEIDKTKPGREWVRFLLANSIGGFVNYTVYGILIKTSTTCSSYPVIAVGFGSLAGLVFNFTVSKKLIFINR